MEQAQTEMLAMSYYRWEIGPHSIVDSKIGFIAGMEWGGEEH